MPKRHRTHQQTADIVVSSLRSVSMPGMTRDRGGSLAQACSVCLDSQGHPIIASATVVGKFEGALSIRRLPVTEQMNRTYGLDTRVTEDGAACLAILLMLRETGLSVLWESKGFNGYDYMLGDDPTFPFKGAKRLEVSGIRSGSEAEIGSRVGEKVERYQRYASGATCYVVVIEFSRLEIRVVELWSTPEN